MTTAKVKHRDYIPRGWIALPFCTIEFFGERAGKFMSMWRSYREDKLDRVEQEERFLKAKIDEYNKEIDKLIQEVKKHRKWWRFWNTPEEKKMLKRIAAINDNLTELFEKKDSIKKKKFINIYEAERFLKEKGFSLTNRSNKGGECITYTDIWVKGRFNE